ncbi:MAG: MlaD family protein [Bacteroidales bacterium]
MKIKREAKLGILLIITLFIFVWGFNYLKGKDIFSRQFRLHTIYDETGGLMETNAVTISGVTVGKVDRIRFHPDGSGKVVVTVVVDHEIEIPSNSVAVLASPGIIGSKEIQISLGNHQTTLNDGDTLQGIRETSIPEEVMSFLSPLREKTESLINETEAVLLAVNQVLDTQNRETLDESIKLMHKTLRSMEALTHMAEESFETESERLSDILVNIEHVSEDMRAAEIELTMKQASESIEVFSGILTKINNGEGSAGMLLSSDTLYRNMESSLVHLDALLKDMQENPRNYFNISVFGR